jgi:hypothetical protein
MRVLLMEEKLRNNGYFPLIPSIIIKKSTETEPPQKEVKGEGLISCEAKQKVKDKVAWNDNHYISLNVTFMLISMS